MTTQETIGALILALDLYRLSLAKQYKERDTSKDGFIIDQGNLLIEGIQDVHELFRSEATNEA
jgi:hypothetical protein